MPCQFQMQSKVIQLHTYTYISILFQILFPYRLSQNIDTAPCAIQGTIQAIQGAIQATLQVALFLILDWYVAIATDFNSMYLPLPNTTELTCQASHLLLLAFHSQRHQSQGDKKPFPDMGYSSPAGSGKCILKQQNSLPTVRAKIHLRLPELGYYVGMEPTEVPRQGRHTPTHTTPILPLSGVSSRKLPLGFCQLQRSQVLSGINKLSKLTQGVRSRRTIKLLQRLPGATPA